VLLCAYSAPTPLLSSLSVMTAVLRLDFEAWLVWPDCVMEASELFAPRLEAGPQAGAGASRGWWGAIRGKGGPAATAAYSWRVGVRRGCYLGVLCTRETELCGRPFEDTTIEVPEPGKGGATKKMQCRRIICRAKAHAWVVVVGTAADFASLHQFYEERCLAITCTANESEDGRFICRINDPLEGALTVSV